MASEWAWKKARKAVGHELCGVNPHIGACCQCVSVAAALDEARAEGEKSGAERKRSGVERAWLIESRFTPAPTWWTGTDHPAPWTRDSLKAVRFCRKCDAEAAMAALQDGHFCFASEHQWGLGPMRGPEEE